MRLYVETSVRWQATFENNGSISDLRAAIRDTTSNGPVEKGLRSICWKAFLLFENLDKSTWPKRLSDSRSAYTALRHHFLKDLEHPDNISATDPLTDDKASPWNVLRQDEELRAEIFQDVERCMPENSYFREPETQATLLDILFIFCKLNPDIGYRQGMHEVLAPVLWVITRDAIDPQSFANASRKEATSDQLILACFDPENVEHDVFTIFAIIMQTVKSFYETGNHNPAAATAPLSNTPIVERSKRIHEEFLPKVDPELAEHLTAIDVLPQIFLIRWIRLLFGREFPLDEVLALWDLLFAEDPSLELIDLVCVSMLLRIREQLIESDYSAALTLLLRYPVPEPPHGPQSFLEDALYLHRHMNEDGAKHLKSKYSIGGESSIRSSGSRRGKRVGSARQRGSRRSLSPRMSPARFLQEQGGIEGIIQKGARGVYSRGEQWGVAKALRGAYEGLQSAGNTPKRPGSAPRWSIDTGSLNTDDIGKLTARINTLEQRNVDLAKLLEKAMEELWLQQREVAEQKSGVASDALSLAIAKVQFVQVYLENPTMPLPAEEASYKRIEEPPVPDRGFTTDLGSPTRRSTQDQSPTRKASVRDSRRKSKNDGQGPSLPASPRSPSKRSGRSSTPLDSIPDLNLPQDSSDPPASPKSRPALSQSSFSWMLGQEQRISEFVAASPFSTEKDRARGRAGFLFGDKEAEDSKDSSPARKAKKGDKDGKEGRQEKGKVEEAITLADMAAGIEKG